MSNLDAIEYLMLAGHSEETAKELIHISFECGVPLITDLYPYNNIAELEYAVRKKNTLGY